MSRNPSQMKALMAHAHAAHALEVSGPNLGQRQPGKYARHNGFIDDASRNEEPVEAHQQSVCIGHHAG